MNQQLHELSNLAWPRTLQAAAAIFSFYNGTSLAPNGCFLGERLYSERNCTIACQNLTHVFGSAETFQNCLSYPTINQLVIGANLTAEDIDTASSYGIHGSQPTLAADTVQNTARCLAGYCASSKTCTQALKDHPFGIPANSTTFPLTKDDTYRAYYFDNLSGTLGTVSTMCDAVKRTAAVNADISGIGVFIAYLMQASISIIACLLLKFWDSGLYYICLIHRGLRYGLDGARITARQTHEKWIMQKYKLVEGLIEFHKAQCFFMFAIQTAALIAKHGNLLDRDSLQQIYNDNIFIDVLSVGGYLPISFVLFTLRTIGHRSWYLIILSACTMAISAAAFLTASFSVPLLVSSDYHYAACGNINPTTLCLESSFTIPAAAHGSDLDSRLDTLQDSRLMITSGRLFPLNVIAGPGVGAGSATLILALIVLTVLIFDLYKSGDTSKSSGETEGARCRDVPGLAKKTLVYLSEKAHGAFHGLPSFVTFVAFIAFYFYYLRNLNYFRHPAAALPSGYIPLDLSRFTFGQIAAITVWLQPLIQYAYLEICGVEGRRWHLPKEFGVIALENHIPSTGVAENAQENEISNQGKEGPKTNKQPGKSERDVGEGDCGSVRTLKFRQDKDTFPKNTPWQVSTTSHSELRRRSTF